MNLQVYHRIIFLLWKYFPACVACTAKGPFSKDTENLKYVLLLLQGNFLDNMCGEILLLILSDRPGICKNNYKNNNNSKNAQNPPHHKKTNQEPPCLTPRD